MTTTLYRWPCGCYVEAATGHLIYCHTHQGGGEPDPRPWEIAALRKRRAPRE